jgi:ATP-dependent Clp protease ATP-binding subunit ClpA
MSSLPKFDSTCAACINQANLIAVDNRSEYLTLETLLLGILSNDSVREKMEPIISDYDELMESLHDFIESEIPKSDNSPTATRRVEQVLNQTCVQGMFHAQKNISILDLLYTLLGEKDSWAVTQAKNYGLTKKSLSHQLGKEEPADHNSEAKALAQYCVNLTEQAKAEKLDPCLGRSTEMDELEHVLCRRTKHNSLLIGDPGVGKTAIVEGLALKIAKNEVFEDLKDSEIWSLDIAALMAGTKYRGDLEERFKQIVKELSERKKSILFVDEAHMLNNPQQNSMDISNMLKPGLSRRQFKVIAATTWEDYRKSFEKDRAFMRRFNRITINEPSNELCKEIVKGVLPQYQKHHGVKVSLDEIDRIVSLTSKWITDRKQPDKSIDVLDAAMTRSRMEKSKTLNSSHIDLELSRMTMLPPETFATEKEHAVNVDDIDLGIRSQVFGQDAAVDQVLDRVYIAHAGLKNPNRPLAQFLFLGPTGVGKTELAKALAQSMRLNFIKFDMSEYQEQHSVSKLIGAPPGYVGFDDANLGGGLLISAVEKSPHCVLLMDEIEKADPRVSNVLLQLMDSGTITSSNGKKIDCRNVILILTSNLGAAQAEKATIGFMENDRGDEEAATKQFFAPEFRNRLDAVVKFNKLGQTEILQVAKKFIGDVNLLLADRKCKVELTDSAYDFLVKEGYDQKMGARPMSRAVDQHVKVPLSKLLLKKRSVKNKKFKFDHGAKGMTIVIE